MPTARQIKIEQVYANILARDLYKCDPDAASTEAAEKCGCTPDEVYDAAMAVTDATDDNFNRLGRLLAEAAK